MDRILYCSRKYAQQSSNQWIVFLHGLFETSRTWEKLFSKWRPDCNMLMIDLPGHGKNRSFTVDGTLEDICSDIDDLLTSYRIDIIHLVGFSMGGRIACIYAAMYPLKVKTLTMIDIDLFPNNSYVEFKSFFSRYSGCFKSMQEAVRTYQGIIAENGHNPLADLFIKRLVKENGNGYHWCFDPQSALKMLRCVMLSDYLPHLDKIPCPTLLLRAARSKNLVLEDAQSISKQIKNCLLVEVSNTNHAIHKEAPGYFAAVFKKFLKDNS